MYKNWGPKRGEKGGGSEEILLLSKTHFGENKENTETLERFQALFSFYKLQVESNPGTV